jgi:hypothetical protein
MIPKKSLKRMKVKRRMIRKDPTPTSHAIIPVAKAIFSAAV